MILTGYVGSLLMAASYLAIGAALSATTRNQVVAFILTVSICFMFLVSGLPMVLDVFSGWAPDELILAIANLSLINHFDNLQKGVVALSDIIYFASVIGLWLWINRAVIERKREAG